jgi:hypothetical protein
MENTRVTNETIEKYFNCLVDLKNILSYTDRISMDNFCAKNNLSKSLPQILKKGGIIKCNAKGRYSQWEWTSIEPTRQMALKCVQMLGEYNPPRKKNTVKISYAAKKFNVTERTIQLWCNAENVNKIGNEYQLTKDLLDKWLLEKGEIVKEKIETRGGSRQNSGRKTKEVELQSIIKNKNVKINLFWGLFSFNFNL